MVKGLGHPEKHTEMGVYYKKNKTMDIDSILLHMCEALGSVPSAPQKIILHPKYTDALILSFPFADGIFYCREVGMSLASL